ncbi:MAG: hypothetical protein FJ267_02905, partial [Planctomycetes bacterium]|nr:hypothetical protein [Planctomycetota bacterium]
MSERNRGVVDGLARWLSNHALWIVGLVLLITVASFSIIHRLKFDFTPQAIYRGNDSLVSYAEDFKKTFGYDEAILLTVLQAPQSTDVLTPAALQWQADVALKVQGLHGIGRVDALPLLKIPQRNLLGSKLVSLFDEFPITDESADSARELLSNSELVHVGLLSRDNRIAAIAAYLEPEFRNLESMQRIVREVNDVIREHAPPERFNVFLNGLPTLRVELVRGWIADLRMQLPIAALVYLVLLGIVFRRFSGAVLPILAVGAGLTWTLALFAATGETLNFVSNALPALLVIIGVSGCTQIVTCYASESVNEPNQRIAGEKTIRKMAPAGLLAAATTAIGFVSLMTAQSELLIRFGWQACLGVSVQYLSTLLVLGVLIQFFRPPSANIIDNDHPSLVTQVASFFGSVSANRPLQMILGTVIVAVLAIGLGSRVVINTYSCREVLSDHHPLMKTMRIVETELIGIMPLEISLETDNPDQWLQPEMFHRLLKFEEYARELPGVLSVQSYADLFREILVHWPGRRSTESNNELIPLDEKGRTRMERTAEFSDRYNEALHYSSYISSDGKRARIRMRLSEIGSQKTLEVIRSLEDRLQRVFPDNGPIRYRLTGEAYVNATALTVLIRDWYYSLL